MKALFLFILLIMFLLVDAQNNYMSISIGKVFPLESFQATNDLKTNGFALSGISGDYSGAFFLKKNVGIAGDIRFASNSLADNLVASYLKEELFNQDLPFILPDTLNSTISVGIWNQVSFMAGPEITLLANNFNFDFNALGGINFIFPPDMSLSFNLGESSYERKLETRSISYALNIGLAIRYHLSDKSSIRLHCSYFQSNVRGHITNTILYNNTSTTALTPYNCRILSMNVGIGLVYRLNNK